MKTKIKNFEDFLTARNNFYASLGNIELELRRVGIELNTKTTGLGVVLNWHQMDDITKQVGKRDFFNPLTSEECFALAIAVSEELSNGYCDSSVIDLVNKFFNVGITREIINKMHGEFI